MLVLSRHRDDKIVITPLPGLRITITVCEVRGDKARIGIEAPKSVIVHRGEVQEAIDRTAGLKGGTEGGAR